MNKITNMEFKMKKIIMFLSCMFLANNAMATENVKTVFINQIIRHPALDSTEKGIRDGLAKNGYVQDKNLKIYTELAQGNPTLAAQITSKAVNKGADVLVTIGTVPTQGAVNYAQGGRVEVVFASVTDPVGAGIVKNLVNPGKNISGVSNFINLEPQLRLFLAIQPGLKKLGLLYNPGEPNSLSIKNRLEKICRKMGIKLILQSANTTSAVPQAATQLANRVDAIFISNDNTALAALQSIIAIATKAKIPVYVSDTDSVKIGALAALGPNQYQVGLQTGAMVARSLNGEKLETMPVEFPNKTELYLNKDAAAALGITLTKEILDKASKIIGKGCK
jgi:putative tryptophan/tyrosine transport system substrate-binding protein